MDCPVKVIVMFGVWAGAMKHRIAERAESLGAMVLIVRRVKPLLRADAHATHVS
jgi:hypothetical protein